MKKDIIVMAVSVGVIILAALIGYAARDKQAIALIEPTTVTFNTTTEAEKSDDLLSTSESSSASTSTTETTTSDGIVYTGEVVDTYAGVHRVEAVESFASDKATDVFTYKGKTINLKDNIEKVVNAYGQTISTTAEAVEAETEASTEQETNAEGGRVIVEVDTEATTSDPHIYNYEGFVVQKNDNNEVMKISVYAKDIKTPSGAEPIGSYIFDITERFGPPTDLDGSKYLYEVEKHKYMYFLCPDGIVSEWGIEYINQQ